MTGCVQGGTFASKVGPEQHATETIPMAGGYGVDVQVRDRGDDKIATKVPTGATSPTDGFGYTAK